MALLFLGMPHLDQFGRQGQLDSPRASLGRLSVGYRRLQLRYERRAEIRISHHTGVRRPRS